MFSRRRYAVACAYLFMFSRRRDKQKRPENFTQRAREIRSRPLGAASVVVFHKFVLTPSAASADPVNPPFVTLTIWTNKELFGPHERFRTEHTQKSWYKHITISHPDIPHTIHTTLFSCPKRTNLPHPFPTHSTDSANLDEPTTFCPRERLRIKPTQKSWRRNTSRFSIPAHIYLCSLGAGMR